MIDLSIASYRYTVSDVYQSITITLESAGAVEWKFVALSYHSLTCYLVSEGIV